MCLSHPATGSLVMARAPIGIVVSAVTGGRSDPNAGPPSARAPHNAPRAGAAASAERPIPDRRPRGRREAIGISAYRQVCRYHRDTRRVSRWQAFRRSRRGAQEPGNHPVTAEGALEGYEHFDNRGEGRTKVVLEPAMAGA